MVRTTFRHVKKRSQEKDVGKCLKIQLSYVNKEIYYDYGGERVLEDFCVSKEKMEPIRELFIQLVFFLN